MISRGINLDCNRLFDAGRATHEMFGQSYHPKGYDDTPGPTLGMALPDRMMSKVRIIVDNANDSVSQDSRAIRSPGHDRKQFFHIIFSIIIIYH